MLKNISALLAVAALLNFTACQKNVGAIYEVGAAKSSKIVGGEIVQPSDIVANSTVALTRVFGSHTSNFCTGTLITPILVLTAAHCVQHMNKKAIRISFAIDVKDQLDPEIMLEVADIISHKKYDYERLNDIALILLKKPAPAPYKPVAIVSDKYTMTVSMPMLLAGYGVIDDTTSKETEALRKVTVPMAKILDADSILVTDQTKTTGACNGDSGGPAYLEKEGVLFVYGVTRGPHDSAPDCHHYGEYTWASKFESFILEAAAEMKTEAPVFVVP